MGSNWASLAEKYKELISIPASLGSNESIKKLVGQAASVFPKDNPEKLSWFISALQHGSNKWFVAKVLALVYPIPRALFDPLVLAALLERNPSNNRHFIALCVRSFGVKETEERIYALANEPGVAENNGVQQIMYWVPRVGT